MCNKMALQNHRVLKLAYVSFDMFVHRMTLSCRNHQPYIILIIMVIITFTHMSFSP